MINLPFYVVTLTHAEWEDAVQCAKKLPPEALPELRLDLFPALNAREAIQALGRSSIVTCRRTADGGRFEGSEAERLTLLMSCLEARPAWMDLEWELPIPREIQEARSHLRLLRSVHVESGCFDLPERLTDPPPGDAYKWVGFASRLSDNAKLLAPLAFAKDHQLRLSAFLMGKKGEVSRCLQGIWGGAFTYAAPDNAPEAAPGQLPIHYLMSLRAHKLNKDYGICAHLGQSLQDFSPAAFHNATFQRAFKDLVCVRLACSDAQEAAEALEKLDIRCASLTQPLLDSLPALLGLKEPQNTLWKENGVWRGGNTGIHALKALLPKEGPVLLLGGQGMASTTSSFLKANGMGCLRASSQQLPDPEAVAKLQPMGVVMADPHLDPFKDVLTSALPSLRWALTWEAAPETPFTRWAQEKQLNLIKGQALEKIQLQEQSKLFLAHG